MGAPLFDYSPIRLCDEQAWKNVVRHHSLDGYGFEPFKTGCALKGRAIDIYLPSRNSDFSGAISSLAHRTHFIRVERRSGTVVAIVTSHSIYPDKSDAIIVVAHQRVFSARTGFSHCGRRTLNMMRCGIDNRNANLTQEKSQRTNL
jgi:hypothetical protein